MKTVIAVLLAYIGWFLAAAIDVTVFGGEASMPDSIFMFGTAILVRIEFMD